MRNDLVNNIKGNEEGIVMFLVLSFYYRMQILNSCILTS